MTKPCCPTCGHPLTQIALVGPPGLTAMKCQPCGKHWQKPDWR